MAAEELLLQLHPKVGIKLAVKEDTTAENVLAALHTLGTFLRPVSASPSSSSPSSHLTTADNVTVEPSGTVAGLGMLNLVVSKPTPTTSKTIHKKPAVAKEAKEAKETKEAKGKAEADTANGKAVKHTDIKKSRPTVHTKVRVKADESAPRDQPQSARARPSAAAHKDPGSARGVAKCPALEEAQQKVKGIHPNDLRKWQKMNDAPPEVGCLMEAVLTALGVSRTSWDTAQKELADIKFLDRVASAPPILSDRSLRKVEGVLAEAPEKKVGAAAVLYEWLAAFVGAVHSAKEGKKDVSGTHNPPSHTQAAPAGEGGGHGQSGLIQLTPEDLEKATEALEEAAAEVSKLTNAELRELRSQSQPSSAAAAVMAAVLAALGEKDTSWEGAKKALHNTKLFGETLTECSKSPEKSIQLGRQEYLILNKLIKEAGNAQLGDSKDSKPLGCLLQWARAAHAFACKTQKKETHMVRSTSAGEETGSQEREASEGGASTPRKSKEATKGMSPRREKKAPTKDEKKTEKKKEVKKEEKKGDKKDKKEEEEPVHKEEEEPVHKEEDKEEEPTKTVEDEGGEEQHPDEPPAEEPEEQHEHVTGEEAPAMEQGEGEDPQPDEVQEDEKDTDAPPAEVEQPVECTGADEAAPLEVQ